jgi:adenylyl cyclase-associated protein
VKPLVDAQLDFLRMASQHQKPGSMEAFAPLLKPQADAIGAIMEAKDKLGRGKEGREWGAAFSVLSEGAPAWGWVQVEPAPAPYVGEMKNAAQFWVDRVIKQFKETNPDALAWARSFSSLVDTLQKYVKQWHTTGVVWNPKGSPAPDSMPAPGAAPAAPPPPPPAPAAPTPSSGGSGGGGGGHAALLASLNKGGAITSGLKKVDPSQQTHKNPELRAAGTVPERSVSPSKRQGPPVKAKPAGFSRAPAAPAKKPPKLELEGNKWAVDNQEDARNLEIKDTALHHTVHLFNCKNTVLRVHGKINALTMVNCKKTSVVLESVVSSVSVTSSPSFEVQITGMCPTVQVDTTDSGNIFLSKECMDTVEVVTSKTSALNISIPAGEDGDFVERPVPEQMRSRVVDGKLVTEIVEHAG